MRMKIFLHIRDEKHCTYVRVYVCLVRWKKSINLYKVYKFIWFWYLFIFTHRRVRLAFIKDSSLSLSLCYWNLYTETMSNTQFQPLYKKHWIELDETLTYLFIFFSNINIIICRFWKWCIFLFWKKPCLAVVSRY